jgi:hypothetical protein
LFKVQVQAQADDPDELVEVDVKVVRLGAVGLPEERRGRMAELGDGTAWFAG